MERNQMMSPDTVSSLFPDRPIRPLPKRRLRERLSPEAADAIKYPQSTQGSVPLFQYPPYTLKEEIGQLSPGGPPESALPSWLDEAPRILASQSRAGEEAYPGIRSTLVTRSPPEILNRTGRQSGRPEQPRQVETQPPLSATSSVDGYDSFENTNNKKKRKIPSAGESSINGSHGLSSEINALGLSSTIVPTIEDSSHGIERIYHGSNSYQTPTSYAPGNQGFSGPGRGRLGRSRNGRSPLRALPDGNTSWPGRGAKTGGTHWAAGSEGAGIISSAIANAEKLPPQGQENVSLLQQHSSTPRTTPASAQFTFTCDSQVPGTVPWPGEHSRESMAAQAPGLQTPANTNNSNHDMPPAGTSHQPAQSLRKTRHQLDRELKTAARHRRQAAADNFYHNPPKFEDLWICEFCEYERIFGEPPKALIRDYEIKDRRHRREEADRKRLLEKAKAKSRKSKKASKALNKGAASGHPHPDHHLPSDYIDDHETPPMHHEHSHSHSHSTQSEDDYDEGLVDCGVDSQPCPVHQEGDGGGTRRRERAKS